MAKKMNNMDCGRMAMEDCGCKNTVPMQDCGKMAMEDCGCKNDMTDCGTYKNDAAEDCDKCGCGKDCK